MILLVPNVGRQTKKQRRRMETAEMHFLRVAPDTE